MAGTLLFWGAMAVNVAIPCSITDLIPGYLLDKNKFVRQEGAPTPS